MRTWYQKRMYDWETRLTTRDTNRVVRPFEWGADWTQAFPGVNGNGAAPPAPREESGENYFHELNRYLVAHSDDFFAHRTPTDFRLEKRPVRFHRTSTDLHTDPEDRGEGLFLRFTSPFPSPFPENNLANARWFPARGKRAVIVLPQWNADALSHNALCRMFNLLGISALRLSKPYHDVRMPAELERADYAVSSNIGRTIAASRQAIGDIRACVDWPVQTTSAK